MTAPTIARSIDRPAARWRRTLVEHQAVDGRCPICGTPRRCREWGEAFGQLVAHDLLLHPSPQRRPAAPDGRLTQGDDMDNLTWRKPSKCDNSGPNCPEVAVDKAGAMHIRSTKRPGEVAILDADEAALLREAIVAGEL